LKGKTRNMNSESVQEQIHQYIQEELNDGIVFDRDANLIQQGLIDSMGVMKLIVFLEKRFDIEIELEEITAENFETLNLISNLVVCTQEKRAG
jgi:acyl carrier protein